MVKIYIRDNFIKVSPIATFAGILRDRFMLYHTAWRFRYIYNKGIKTKKMVPVRLSFSLYDRKTGTIPVGLYKDVIAIFEERNIQYKIIDEREEPDPLPFQLGDINEMLETAWDHQKEAYYRALIKKRGIIKFPTGTGKTYLAKMLISGLNLKTLIVVGTLELLNQFYGSLVKSFGIKNVGIIGDGKYTSRKAITIATVQTLWSRRNTFLVQMDLGSFDLFFLDEGHHCNKKDLDQGTKNSWYQISNNIDATYKFALTATPGRPGDISRQMLESVFGKIIVDKNIKQMVEKGILSIPKIYMYKFRHNKLYFDWHTAKSFGIADNDSRNDLIAYIALQGAKKDKQILIHTDRVKTQGQYLYNRLKSHGACFAHGGTSKEDRKHIRQRFLSGELKILIGTIFGEGVDFPDLDCIINASGGLLEKNTLQRLGRALRKGTDKTHGVIIDIYDIVDPRTGAIKKAKKTLSKHSSERKRVYEETGYECNIKEIRLK
jgi:superfamily II DNA or RNA helicase